MTCVQLDAPDPPRVAYAVGRSVGDAVTRNQLRRRLRAAVRANADALRHGRAYLVGARREAVEAAYPTLVHDLRELLESCEAST